MNKPLRLLLVEDSEDDAELVLRQLRRGGFDPTSLRVETEAAMSAALREYAWDLVIADYKLPSFNAPAALALSREDGRDLPFIVVSGAIGEDAAVSTIKQGADDYLFKDRLLRLEAAVTQALEKRRLREEKRRADQQVRDSERRFRAIIEHSTDGVALLGAEGAILYASPATTRILGYAVDDFVGRNAFDLIHPEDLPTVTSRFARLLQNPLDITVTQFRCRHKDGSWRWLEGVASNLLAEASVQGIVTNYRDITDRQSSVRRESEMLLAHRIQKNLFPAAAPRGAGFEVGGASHPADATGGDYFDYLTLPDGSLGIVVGDVSGHGFGPALLMASTRAYLRALAQTNTDISDILTIANRLLVEDIRDDHFVTLVFARFHPATRVFRYASAGHPSCYVLDPSGAVKARLESTSPPLGVLLDCRINAGAECVLDPGDLVLFITDGIVEARSPDEESFGADRAVEIARVYRHGGARDISENIYYAVRAFSQDGPQVDDISVVVLKVGAGE